jgi:hypothetical protein
MEPPTVSRFLYREPIVANKKRKYKHGVDEHARQAETLPRALHLAFQYRRYLS